MYFQILLFLQVSFLWDTSPCIMEDIQMITKEESSMNNLAEINFIPYMILLAVQINTLSMKFIVRHTKNFEKKLSKSVTQDTIMLSLQKFLPKTKEDIHLPVKNKNGCPSYSILKITSTLLTSPVLSNRGRRNKKIKTSNKTHAPPYINRTTVWTSNY